MFAPPLSSKNHSSSRLNKHSILLYVLSISLLQQYINRDLAQSLLFLVRRSGVTDFAGSAGKEIKQFT